MKLASMGLHFKVAGVSGKPQSRAASQTHPILADSRSHDRESVASDLPRFSRSSIRSENGVCTPNGAAATPPISGHPAVVFADNFESGELGAKWDQTNNRGANALPFVNRSAGGSPVGARSLQVTATLRENMGGASIGEPAQHCLPMLSPLKATLYFDNVVIATEYIGPAKAE